MNQALLKRVRENIRAAKCEVLQASIDMKDIGRHPALTAAEEVCISSLRLLDGLDRELTAFAETTAAETAGD